MISKTVLVITVTLFTVSFGCSESPTHDPAFSEPSNVLRIAEEYHSYVLMTPEPYEVNPFFAISCSAIRKEDLDRVSELHGPHTNTVITIYMNKNAANAYENESVYLPGSIIVKEKRKQGYFNDEITEIIGKGTGVGGMIKRKDGYDPENGNWEYFYYESTDDITSGRIQNCSLCHEKAKEADWVFGTWDQKNIADPYED